jgi:hypothetical protein
MGARLATVALLFLVLLVGGGNLWATYSAVNQYKAQQQQSGQEVERKLCATLNTLAALKPPPLGNPTANPSRVYEINLQATLSALGPDVGCPRKG